MLEPKFILIILDNNTNTVVETGKLTVIHKYIDSIAAASPQCLKDDQPPYECKKQQDENAGFMLAFYYKWKDLQADIKNGCVESLNV